MKLVKSLLLGSTAALTAAAGAQAADLPSRKAAPVEYVKICDAYGAGFFYIPGTDTCLRVGGYVRAEYDYTPGQSIVSANDVLLAPKTSATTGVVTTGGTITALAGAVTQVGADQDQVGMEIRGRIDIDGRTQTSYGTVQTVVHLRMADTNGIRATASSTNFVTAFVPQTCTSAGTTLERAYIRFAGFTFGVGSENATTMPSYMYSSNVYAGFPNGMPQLAYTATFGGGFSATAAVEDINSFGYVRPGAGTGAAPSTVVTSSTAVWIGQWDTNFELVGNVRYDASWGYIQLAGLIGNDSAGCAASTASPTGQICSASNNLLLGPTKYGEYGLMGSFGVKLPMIAPGDEFHAQVGYGNGFIGAVESAGSFNDLSDASNKRVLGGVIRSDSNLVPTLVSSTGAIEQYGLTKSWGIYGIFTHYWTPNWRSNVAAGYWDVTPPTASANATATTAGNCVQTVGAIEPATCAGLNTQWGHGDAFQLSGNIIWSPAANFDIGLDVEYLNIHSVLQNPNPAFVAAGEPGLSENGLIYHLRVERTF